MNCWLISLEDEEYKLMKKMGIISPPARYTGALGKFSVGDLIIVYWISESENVAPRLQGFNAFVKVIGCSPEPFRYKKRKRRGLQARHYKCTPCYFGDVRYYLKIVSHPNFSNIIQKGMFKISKEDFRILKSAILPRGESP